MCAYAKGKTFLQISNTKFKFLSQLRVQPQLFEMHLSHYDIHSYSTESKINTSHPTKITCCAGELKHLNYVRRNELFDQVMPVKKI